MLRKYNNSASVSPMRLVLKEGQIRTLTPQSQLRAKIFEEYYQLF